jgi:hypothetical protein
LQLQHEVLLEQRQFYREGMDFFKNAKLFMNNYGAAKQHFLFNEDIDDLFDENKFANTMRRY